MIHATVLNTIGLAYAAVFLLAVLLIAISEHCGGS